MSIELKIKFGNMAELTKFVTNNPSVQTSTSSSLEVPSVIKEATVVSEEAGPKELTKAQKTAATKARNKKLKEEAAQEAAQLQQNQVAPTANAASVMAAPVVETATPAVDRIAYQTHATALVGRLQALGMPDADIPVKMQELYTNAGIEYKKVSELSDQDMVTIVSAFDHMVGGLEAAATAAPAASFV